MDLNNLRSSKEEGNSNKGYLVSISDFPEIEENTKEKVNRLIEGNFSTDNGLDSRKATIKDIRYWFFSLNGKNMFRSILLLPPGKRYNIYHSFVRGWNNQSKEGFHLPETPDELYEIVTGKSGIGLRRKFGEIYDILSGEVLNDWYMNPDELLEWYKTPDDNGKTGRDYIFEGIRCNFHSSWRVIAKNINKRRRMQNLGLIQETPTGLIRCISEKGNAISDMLVAFGEPLDQINILMIEIKTSKEKEATKEDIKIWFHEKGGKDFLENLLDIPSENRSFKYRAYCLAVKKKSIKDMEELSYDFPEKITDLFRVATGREYKRGKNDPLKETYDFLLTGSESGRCMTSQELKQWYIETDGETRNGRGIIIEAIGKGFFHGWKEITEKENIKRKQRGLPLIHISASGIMKTMVPTGKMQLLPFLMAFGETEAKAIELLEELKKGTGKYASKKTIQEIPKPLKKIKKKTVLKSSRKIPGTEVFLVDHSPSSRIYFALFIRGIEAYGVPKKWLTPKNLCFLNGEREGVILVSHKIIDLVGKGVLINLAEKSSESGHKIVSKIIGGWEMNLSVEAMKTN